MATIRDLFSRGNGFAELLALAENTGVTYNAKGSEVAPVAAYQERGGARYVGLPDRVPELRTRQQRIRTYAEMADTDVTVDVSLRTPKIAAQGATFYIEPYDDTPEAAIPAEFAEDNLLHVAHGANRPFLTSLEDILRFFDDGFSILEPVWEKRVWAPRSQKGANRRNYDFLARLSPRPGNTITDIRYKDNGDLDYVVQNKILADNKTEQVNIPADKMIVFTWNRKGSNIEGKSILP